MARDPDETTGWQPTYRATAIIAPIQHLGSRDDCKAWCLGMMGQEVWIEDADGRRHIVGVVQETEFMPAND